VIKSSGIEDFMNLKKESENYRLTNQIDILNAQLVSLTEEVSKLRTQNYKIKAELDQSKEEHLIEIRSLTDFYNKKIESSLLQMRKD